MFRIITTLLLATLCAFAQFDSAAVVGSVRDERGGAISGAKVVLRNNATGITLTTDSSEAGDFIFPTVRIGNYKLTAEKTGFASGSSDNIVLTVNARQRIDLTLRVGQVSEIVNVEATTPLLESESSSKGQVIAAKQVVELPLQGRSYANLALLAPGVRQSQSGNQGSIAFRREGSYNVNGLRSVWNNFLLDGIDNNFYGTTNQGFSNQSIQPSPDSVAEFRLIVNAYSAEFGRSGGAVMNVASKSGTNQFHGAVWHFLQNEALNATGFFKPTLNQKPINKRNQFGAAVGGPIIKDRTFFFADYEGSRWSIAPFSLTSVPNADMRRGVLPLDVRAPFGFTDDTGRSIAAGTVFPAGTPIPMTRFARRVMSELPQANRAGGGALGIGTNFGGFDSNRLTDDKGAIKVDHQLSSNLTSFFRFAQRRQNIVAPGLITGFAGGNNLGNLDTFNQQGIAGVTWSKSPTEVIEYRFAVTRLGMDRTPAAVGGPSMRELFGITGLPEGPRIQGGITPQDIQGFPRFGRQSTNPQAQFPTTLNSRMNLSKIINRHNLKMGYELLYMNILVDDTNPLYGIDGYAGFYSRLPGQNLGALAGASANTVHSLADFYFGGRSSYQLATQVQANVRQQAHWFYIQDDFKVNSKLTLNMGLRYEMTTPAYDANNRLANFDPAQNRLVVASGDNGIEGRTLQRQTWNNFAPRLGAAYTLNSKTVLRGGYGFGWNYWNRMASAEYLNTNAPFVVRFSAQNSPAQLGNLCSANNFANCFRTREQGYPVNPPSNVILHMDRNTPWGYVQNWHFTIQRTLFKNTLLDVAYVGNRADRLPVLGDFNQARPITQAELNQGLTTLGTLNARRPYQGFGNITAVVPFGFSNYNAFQMKFEHRGDWLTVLNSFTYGKAIDTVGQVLEGSVGGSPNPQDIRNVANDKGASSFDQRWNNTTSFVVEVPFGKGRKFGRDMNSGLDAIIGGWQVSAIVNSQSGLPLNLRYPDASGALSDGQPDFLGNVALRPNVINGSIGVLAPESERSFTNYFNRANLAVPAVTAPFGNLGRNVAYGFPLYQTDLVLSKSFAMRFINEGARLQFRSEFYNFFNKTNFAQPEINLASANFGRVGSTFDPRFVQFALKLQF
jgi:hypothetical protein